MQFWVLLVYKVPPQPSARRVYVWRKLKRLGAVLLHDSVWVLPANDRTREHFQWLASEIVEMEGEAFVWETHLTLVGQDEILIKQFTDSVEVEYSEILTGLSEPECDLEALSRRYQQVKSRDYFQSEMGERVRQAIITARGGR
jgi:hypothetical protein